jgi:glycosyltransferase involved in cell wall biosynthesis
MYGVRNPRTLLQAFDELVVEGKIQKEKIQIKFIGRFGLEVREMIAKSIVSSSIEVKPYIPHTESIVELMKSDVLLLVVDETVDSNEIVPGKVFEYIGAKKPILALAPKGAIEDIIKETRSGIVVANQDVQGIKEAIMILYKKYCDNEQLTTPDNEVIRKYERKEITRQLSELLNSL